MWVPKKKVCAKQLTWKKTVPGEGMHKIISVPIEGHKKICSQRTFEDVEHWSTLSTKTLLWTIAYIFISGKSLKSFLFSRSSKQFSPNYCRGGEGRGWRGGEGRRGEGSGGRYFPGRSTETALVKIVDDILGHIDGRSVVTLLSLDISAAFDMVDHNLLLERLSVEFGVTGAARDWIASYLR